MVLVSVFDRMFSLGVRGSGIETVPLTSRGAVSTAVATVNGPRRHFLYCTLKPDANHKSKTKRARAQS